MRFIVFADHPNATPDDKRSSPGNSVKRQKTTERAKRTDSRSSHQSPRPQGGSPAQGAAATRGCQGNSVTKTPSGQTPKRAPGSSQKTRAGSSLRHSPSATAGRTVSSDVQPGTCGESSSGRATSAAASKNSASEAVIHCAIRKSPDEALTDSEPIRFLLTKVTGIDAEFNNCLAMDIKGVASLARVASIFSILCSCVWILSLQLLLDTCGCEFRRSHCPNNHDCLFCRDSVATNGKSEEIRAGT